MGRDIGNGDEEYDGDDWVRFVCMNENKEFEFVENYEEFNNQ